MKKCGKTFLNARFVTAQESAYRTPGLPVYKFNFTTVWISDGLPNKRVGLVKTSILSGLDDADADFCVWTAGQI